MKQLSAAVVAFFTSITAFSQEVHFAQPANMQKWYNPSLRQEDDQRTLNLNFRSVTYKQLVAFKSVAAIADIPLISKAARQSDDRKGYLGIAGGFLGDKSNQGILRNTTLLLGVSYHLPVNVDRTTFINFGVQGSHFESRIYLDGATTPDQFDKYGMISGSAADDPGTQGKINFFSLNTGVSVAHEDDKNAWYAGAGAKHVNRPQANLQGDAEYRMPATATVQGGYKVLRKDHTIGMDLFLNFKAKAYEHIGTVYYNFLFDSEDFDGSVGANVSYRYKDAIIPGLQMQFKKTVLVFSYEVAAGTSKSQVSRSAFELGLRQIW